MVEENNKPVFDEKPLATLLEAAYVLQEHNRELQNLEHNLDRHREQIDARGRATISASPTTPSNGAPVGDYTSTLAQIVEIQRQIQARHLDLKATITLIADRIVEIADAGGCAVGMLNEKTLRYEAASGSMTLPLGSEVALDKALCVASLRTGQVIRCTDVSIEFLLDVEECRRREIQSMIAVPIYQDDNVAGGLELYFATANAFSNQDVHTCQLMAGLITEALVRSKETVLKKSVADERTLMLEVLEKLRPNLAALADTPAKAAILPGNSLATTAETESTIACRKCGHQLMAEEQFCGNCGTPRTGEYGPPTMQSKLAYLWQLQEEAQRKTTPEAAPTSSDTATRFTDQLRPEKPLADSIEEEIPELFIAPELRAHKAIEGSEDHIARELQGSHFESLAAIAAQTSENRGAADDIDTGSQETALAKADPRDSSASGHEFLGQLGNDKFGGGLRELWDNHRGDIYLVIAVILVLVVLRWGILSSHPVGATGRPSPAAHHKVDPMAGLSWFDRMLISLGLAEAPPAPEDKGSPQVQVWVDLQTALYYCPGSNLYGKTPRGKYESQRDAQLDQFEPASRRACE